MKTLAILSLGVLLSTACGDTAPVSGLLDSVTPVTDIVEILDDAVADAADDIAPDVAPDVADEVSDIVPDAPPEVADDVEDVADDVAEVAEDTAPETTESCTAAAESVVTFTTNDGIELEADFWPAATADAPAVVLLHMIPPGNTRTNYPVGFRTLLHDAGFAVLNVDRRGAGGSKGVAKDAYTGDKGVLDAVAARAFLASADCPVDLARFGIIGASNGTTTALDFMTTAPESERPKALVFLTGGGYTENQHQIADHRALLDPQSIRFVFSKAKSESEWSKGFIIDAPATWTFDEYDPGGHGTNMFKTRPESMKAVTDYLTETL